MRSSFIPAIAVGSLLISAIPAGAQQPAIPARGGAEMARADELAGGVLMIVGLVAVLILIGVLVIFDDDDDVPTSP